MRLAPSLLRFTAHFERDGWRWWPSVYAKRGDLILASWLCVEVEVSWL